MRTGGLTGDVGTPVATRPEARKWTTGRIVGLSMILALLACDPQAAPESLEQPLARVAAVVDPSAGLSPRELEDLTWRIVWVEFMDERVQRFIDPLGSEGAFPNRFELEVLGPPAAHFMNDFGAVSPRLYETDIGVALIDSSAAGTYSRQVLVYLPDEIPRGSVSADFLGGWPEPGLHLFEVVDPPCTSYLPVGHPAAGLLDCLRLAAGDLDGLIELRGADGAPFPPPDYPNFFLNPRCDPPWEPCDR